MGLLAKIAAQYRFTRTGISLKDKFYLALPGPALSLSTVFVYNVYIKLYTDVIKLDPIYVGLVYTWFNIWNILNDPLFGIFIDRMKYDPKRGKFLRLMRVTVPFMLVCLVAMLWSDPAWPQKVIYLVFLVELFIFDTAATIFGISSNCYFLLAAPTREERVDVDVLRNYIANIISFFATLVPTFILVGNASANRIQVIVILMGVMAMNAVIYGIALAKLKDKPSMYAVGNAELDSINVKSIWADVKGIVRMRAFRSWFLYSLLAMAPQGVAFTAFLYLMDHVLRTSGFQATLVDVLPMLVVFAVLPVIGTLVKRAGGKRTIYLGMLPYIGGYAALMFARTWWQAVICYTPVMFGIYLINTAARPLGAAIIDENEQQTGTRKTGLFQAVNAILSAPIASLQMIIFLSLIKYFGYNQNAETQSAGAMWGIRLATCLVPIAFGLAGMLPLVFFPYNKAREQELSLYSAERRLGNNVVDINIMTNPGAG
jgi:GPH family glycoside/pentoside/hexuronide:cation symporter